MKTHKEYRNLALALQQSLGKSILPIVNFVVNPAESASEMSNMSHTVETTEMYVAKATQ